MSHVFLDSGPIVSVILCTHDRPEFLSTALACYRHQTYSHRELIVVDDSTAPVDTAAIAAAGGRLIRLPPGTILGRKLNRGIAQARGILIQKCDDDDWYGPGFLAEMVVAMRYHHYLVCSPCVAFVMPVRFFNLERWEVREDPRGHYTGATMMFHRLDWEESPFRPIHVGEDVWFLGDQERMGGSLLPVDAIDDFLQVRHGRHLWNSGPGGQCIEEYLQHAPLYAGGPESLLPDWAVTSYRELRSRLFPE